MGYRRIIIYTQDGRAAHRSGRPVAERRQAQGPPRVERPQPPCQGRGTDNIDRDLWLNEAHDAPPLPEPRYETRDETKARNRRRKVPRVSWPSAVCIGRAARPLLRAYVPTACLPPTQVLGQGCLTGLSGRG